MSGNFRTMLLAATALVATTGLPGLSAQALAQEPAPAPGADPANASESVDPNVIIVTARKREETLQAIPSTVAVATSATIDRLGLTNLTDIAKTTPGLQFDDTFGRDSNRPVIRGQANILGSSGVAYFIDGIYYSGSLADYDIDTVERIEVVKGPQSALYGRNTYSGAINLISKKPSAEWKGRVQADISEHDRYDLTANVRGPLAEGLGISLGGRYYTNKGEFINAFDGSRLGKQRTASAFGMLRYDNGGAVRVSLRANYNDTKDGQPAIFSQSANANNCYADNGALYRGQNRYFCGVILPQQVSSDYKRAFVNPDDAGLKSKVFNAALRFDIDLAPQFTVTSLTGYNHRVADTNTDGDYSGNTFQQVIFAYGSIGPVVGATAPRNLRYTSFANSTQDFTFANHEVAKDFSQELRFSYDGDWLKLLVGGYYFRQHDDTNDTRVVPAGALALAQINADSATAALCAALPRCGAFVPITVTAANLPNSRNTNFFLITNKAVFGSATVNFSKTLSLSAEGRYAQEDITQSTQTYNEGAAIPAARVVSASFKKFTPRVTLSWQATPQHLLYGVYAEGQKPGGFNANAAITAGFPTFDPENNRTFEIGSKNSFLDGALVANLALYHTLVRGYQITQNISVPPNQVSLTRNGGDARINGAEFELLIRPDRHLTVTANYSYVDAKFTTGTDENLGLIYDVQDDGLVNCSTGDNFPAVTGCQSLFGSIVGKSIPRAPQHTVYFDADYRTPIGTGDWNFFAGANVSMVSSSFDQVLNFAKTGGSAVVDARLGVSNTMFKVQAYIRNAFNEKSVAQIIRYADANSDLRRNFIAGLRPGRRVGVILTAGF